MALPSAAIIIVITQLSISVSKHSYLHLDFKMLGFSNVIFLYYFQQQWPQYKLLVLHFHMFVPHDEHVAPMKVKSNTEYQLFHAKFHFLRYEDVDKLCKLWIWRISGIQLLTKPYLLYLLLCDNFYPSKT